MSRSFRFFSGHSCLCSVIRCPFPRLPSVPRCPAVVRQPPQSPYRGDCRAPLSPDKTVGRVSRRRNPTIFACPHTVLCIWATHLSDYTTLSRPTLSTPASSPGRSVGAMSPVPAPEQGWRGYEYRIIKDPGSSIKNVEDRGRSKLASSRDAGTGALTGLFPCLHDSGIFPLKIHLKNSLASYCGMCYKSDSLRKNVVQTSGILGKREWP